MRIHAEAAALIGAVTIGGHAPSIHNTQPWRWRIDGACLELFAVPDRQLAVTDPAGRLSTLSCGAALHHVRVAIAAAGWSASVERWPDESNGHLLARLTVGGRIDVSFDAIRMLQTIRIRHTDRRPVSDTPVEVAALSTLQHTAESEASRLHLLRPSDVIELASAAAHAQDVENMDSSWRQELSYWVGRTRDDGLGIPDDVIPEHVPATTVPGRDFGHGGALPIDAGHDGAAHYTILYGEEDSPSGWLRGGEALSAVWLTAIDHGLTVLPLSAAVEVPGTRQRLRGMLSGLGEPYLVLRIGVADPSQAGSPHTPRLPTDQILDIVT